MIDPMLSLAFAVYSSKGVYALLLGSGISSASGIPTGWEVVLGLIRKLAKLEGEDCEPDPAAWFRKKHGAEPDYSRLLDELVKTPAERQQLLRSYFEPTEDERLQGLKLPSAAHKAIARLVASGYLRVILTTNFDRLTEKALEEAGVNATVISTVDQIAGALPLAHAGATVIKLHGDYLDTRIRNTETELASYDPALNTLLDRVLDEYGLIISGWSGDWDTALRAAIERCPSRRFSTFWTTRSALSERGGALAKCRDAVVVTTQDANQLFETLEARVRALEDLAAPHPLSAKLAVATVKRYLVDPSARIRLHDLVHDETERLFTAINAFSFDLAENEQLGTVFRQRIGKYDALCDTLLSMLVPGCYWGQGEAVKLWVASLERIATRRAAATGMVALLKLHRYPALKLLYAAGLAAVTAGRYDTLASLLAKAKVEGDQGKDVEFCRVVNSFAVEPGMWKTLLGLERRYTPVSDLLYDKLRSPLREYLPRDEAYEDLFDRFEYLLGLVHADLGRLMMEGGWWGPVGCFHWRRDGQGERGGVSRQIGAEVDADGINWPPLKAGLFGGSLDQAKQTKARFDRYLSQVHFY